MHFRVPVLSAALLALVLFCAPSRAEAASLCAAGLFCPNDACVFCEYVTGEGWCCHDDFATGRCVCTPFGSGKCLIYGTCTYGTCRLVDGSGPCNWNMSPSRAAKRLALLGDARSSTGTPGQTGG